EPRLTRKLRQQGRRDRGLEVPLGESRQAVLERDRLALLGEPEAAVDRAGRLRDDRCIAGPAAPPRRTAASLEERQLDTASATERDELLLRPVHLPRRGEVAAVLARVRVADHHLL